MLWSILAGFLFGLWPLVMKKSGLTPMAAAFTLTAVSLVVCLPFLGRVDYQTTGFLTIGFGLAMVAGVMNGFGTIAFQKMLADKNVEIAVGILLVILTQVVVTAIGGRLFYGELFTTKKVAGLVTSVVAVYLLTSK